MPVRRLIPAPLRTLLRPLRRALQPDRPIGYLRSRGPDGISGWIHAPRAPARRVAFQAIIRRGGRWHVLAEGVADRYDAELAAVGVGDARYAFHVSLPADVPPGEVEIRPKGHRHMLQPGPATPIGYLRQRTAGVVAGWAYDRGSPGEALAVEAGVERDGAWQVLATGRADQPEPVLEGRAHGFRLDLPPGLAATELVRVEVRLAGSGQALPYMPAITGFVRIRSTTHVSGWARQPGVSGTDLELAIECTLPGAARVLGHVRADKIDPVMSAARQADPNCGFHFTFDPPLTQAERDSLRVVAVGTEITLAFAPQAAPGFVRELTARRVAGWMRDPQHPAERLGYEVVCQGARGTRILASGIADGIDERLAAAGAKDAACGFDIAFDPPLTKAECDTMEVRWTATGGTLPRAESALLGYIRTCKTTHVEGWVRRAHDPAHRMAITVRCTVPGAERVLAQGVADRHDMPLAATGMADPGCGFRLAFSPPLTPLERDHVVVTCTETGAVVPRVEGAAGVVLGYVRECSLRHVAGWMRREGNPGERLAYEVRCTLPGAERVVARGIANLDDEALAAAGFEEPDCGFRVAFEAPLSESERDHVEVWAQGAQAALPRAGSGIVGYVRERSTRHVAGFIQSAANPAERIAYDVVVADPAGERVIASGSAEQFDRVLFALGVEDPVHGFRLLYEAPISEAEAAMVEVRPRATGQALPPAPDMVTSWKPIRYIAMDIVDNCNLRCPFCLFDHAPVHKTTVMEDDTFARALRFLPFVGPEGLWMSCLHEPTMHPKLPEMIERIPREHRHRMHYTTNLTRRMPDRYWEVLANSGLANLNVSIESRDPAIYERMRKGARHKIFLENWEKLLDAFAKGSAPPPLRYISMAYKSNYRELPELIAWLRAEKRAWKVEIRDTYVAPWIPQAFRDAEFLERHEWEWLRDQLAQYDPTEVTLCLPPEFDSQARPEPVAVSATDAALEAPTAELPVATIELPEIPVELPVPVVTAAIEKKKARVPGLLEGRILHDGTMIVIDSLAGNYPYHGAEVARVNIRDIDDPEAFIMGLMDAAD